MRYRVLRIGALLVPLVDSVPATAAVIVPVSITRGVSAYSSVIDTASGMQDVHNDLPPSSTNPSLTYSITANGSSSLLGWTARGSADSGTVSFVDLGAGRFGVRLSAGTSTSVDANTGTCITYYCRGGASAYASVAFTFDLTAPIHVDTLTSIGPSLRGGSGVSLRRGSESVGFEDLAPGRYTLTGSAYSFAGVQYLQYAPSGYAFLVGYFDYTVIPEPSSGLLVSVGLLGLAGWRGAGAARRP